MKIDFSQPQLDKLETNLIKHYFKACHNVSEYKIFCVAGIFVAAGALAISLVARIAQVAEQAFKAAINLIGFPFFDDLSFSKGVNLTFLCGLSAVTHVFVLSYLATIQLCIDTLSLTFKPESYTRDRWHEYDYLVSHQQSSQAYREDSVENLVQKSSTSRNTSAQQYTGILNDPSQLSPQARELSDLRRKDIENRAEVALVRQSEQTYREGNDEEGYRLAQEAAKHGNPFAQQYLSSLTHPSQLSPQARELSDLRRKDIENRAEVALVRQSEQTYREGNDEEGYRLAQEAAKHGNPFAQQYLSSLTHPSQLSPQARELSDLRRKDIENRAEVALVRQSEQAYRKGNDEEGYRLAHEAAKNGNPFALQYLRSLTPPAQLSKQARELSALRRKDIENGAEVALVRQSEQAYRKGNDEEGYRLAQEAAKNGNPFALQYLSSLTHPAQLSKQARELSALRRKRQ